MDDSKGKFGFFADARRLRSFLRQSWRSADASMRRGAVVMWCVGLMFTIFGVVGDVLETWWSSMPFLTNLLTSLTAFFFAVPVALLVLHDVSHRMTDRAGRRAAMAVLAQSMYRLEASVSALGPVEHSRHSPTGGPPLTTGSILEAARARFGRLQDLEGGNAEDIREATETLRTAIAQWKLDRLPDQFIEEVGRVDIEIARLRDAVRPRFLQSDLEWPLDRQLHSLAEMANDLIKRPEQWTIESYNEWCDVAERFSQDFDQKSEITLLEINAVFDLLRHVQAMHIRRTTFVQALHDFNLSARTALWELSSL
ncbi:hypothetical protein [Nonomuraea dietziae]|uniref:hypothetical protein n=1 Tax=Nonomuraea dietziae TaxID=65515 RepID=UPI0033CA065D